MRLSRLARAILAASCLIANVAARADEPKGCDAFKWPLKNEASLLQATTKAVAVSGSTATAGNQGIELQLLDYGAAGLPKPPERAPKTASSMAGYINYAAPAAAGSYQITVSAAAWIDVIQDGKYVKPSAFSGATGCPGVRKSIRVDLAPSPFTLQISGLTAGSIGIVTTPTPH